MTVLDCPHVDLSDLAAPMEADLGVSIPAKCPAALRSSWSPGEEGVAVVSANIVCVSQHPCGLGAVCQRHQVAGGLCFGDLKRC